MAKGDRKAFNEELQNQQGIAEHGYGYTPATPERTITNTRHGLSKVIPGTPGTPGIGGMQNLTSNLYDTNKQFQSNYQTGVKNSMQSYDDIMAKYREFIGQGPSTARMGSEDTYRGLASGGVDEGVLRARAEAPTRAIYQRGMDEVSRSRALGGGGAGNTNAVLAKMAREMSQGIADSDINAEASIQDLVSRNKATGAAGLAGLSEQDISKMLSSLGGMSSLYSATPGQASTFGNQLLGSQSNLISGQNAIANLMETILGGKFKGSQIPSDGQQIFNNIIKGIGLGGNLFGAFTGAL